MIVCFVARCGWKTDSVANYSSHLRRVHEPIDVYECSLEECRRRFSIRCSFISHLKKNPRWHKSVDRIDRESETDSNVSFSIPITQTEIDGGSRSVVVNREISPLIEESVSIIDYDKLSSDFGNLSIGFNLKWLNKDSLPPKLVFEMQEDVKSIILTPLQRTIDTMCNTGMISSASRTELNKVITMFISEESEYKFIKQLKAVDLYNEPIHIFHN